MARTLIKGDEVNVPTSAGIGVSFSEASVVRLVNTTASSKVITVQETAGGTGVGTFTMLATTTEYLEKNPRYTVFANADGVIGAKVGFTA